MWRRVATLLGSTLVVLAAALPAHAEEQAASESTPTFNDLGAIPLYATTTAGGDTARMPDGSYRTWLAVGGEPSYLAEIDPIAGKVLHTYPLENASGAWGVTVADDGDVFVATYGHGELFRLPWGSDSIENEGAPFATTSFLWEGDTDAKGRFYVGTYEGFADGALPPAHLVSWDPATMKYRDYGTFGDQYIYVRSVSVVGGNAYVGLGPSTGFFKVNLKTGKKHELPPPPGDTDLEKFTYQLDVAGRYLYVLFAGGKTPSFGWAWDLKLGRWAKYGDLGAYSGQSVSSPGAGDSVYMARDGQLTKYSPHTGTFDATGFGLGPVKGIDWVPDPELGRQVLVGGQSNGTMFRYDPVTGKGTLFQPAGLTGTKTAPRSLGVGPDGRVYAGGYFSGGLVAYDLAAGKWTTYDFAHQVEGMTSYKGNLYLGVYPEANLYSYDPSKPWGEDNPKRLFGLRDYQQDRPFALSPAGDYLAIGTSKTYGDPGGALVLYNPADGSHQVFRDPVPHQQVVALAYKDGILYGGTLGCCQQTTHDGEIFAFDVKTGKKLWETVPVPGELGVNALTFDGDGNLWGVTAGKVFEFDVQTRTTQRVNELYPYDWSKTAGFMPRAVNLTFDAHDGMLYGTAISHILRIDPATMQNTTTARGTYFAYDESGGKYWLQDHGYDLIQGRWYE